MVEGTSGDTYPSHAYRAARTASGFPVSCFLVHVDRHRDRRRALIHYGQKRAQQTPRRRTSLQTRRIAVSDDKYRVVRGASKRSKNLLPRSIAAEARKGLTTAHFPTVEVVMQSVRAQVENKEHLK